MAGNRFKGQRFAGIRRFFRGVRELWSMFWHAVGPVVRFVAIVAVLGGFAWAAWRAVVKSPYFDIATIDVVETPHLDRDALIELAGLKEPGNIFRFDPDAARDALVAHPWVATARVEKILPRRVLIRHEERRASGAVVLDVPYLIDATGHPFTRAEAHEVAALPLVTGLTRQDFEVDPDGAYARVREALAVARRYALSPLAARRPLGSVHLAPAGRMELMLGATRVALGRGDFRDKIGRLEQVLDTLSARKVDAAYILLSEDLERAIVKETPRERGLGEELGVRPENGEGVVN